MIRKFKVYYIDLDMDNAEYGSEYQQSQVSMIIEIPFWIKDEGIEEFISNEISDITGYGVNGFCYEEIVS